MKNDAITDMITSIRNANSRKIETVPIFATKTNRNIAKILSGEGFTEPFMDDQENSKNILMLNLKYRGKGKEPYITTSKRISKPGLRIYSNHGEIPKVLGGMGIVILSTSEGILTDREARKKGIGGELLCYVW
jgi:small subunit ribosomal protein S8